MQVGMGILAALCLLFGIAPQVLMNWLVVPAVRSLGFARAGHVSWLGVPAGPAGSVGAVAVTVVLAAVLVGLVLHRLVRRPSGQPVGIFTGGDPLAIADSVVDAADFVGTVEDTFAPAYRIADPDPIYLAVWGRLRDLGDGFDRVVTPLFEMHPLWATLVGGAAVMAVILAF